jgi:hypothetical protein
MPGGAIGIDEVDEMLAQLAMIVIVIGMNGGLTIANATSRPYILATRTLYSQAKINGRRFKSGSSNQQALEFINRFRGLFFRVFNGSVHQWRSCIVSLQQLQQVALASISRFKIVNISCLLSKASQARHALDQLCSLVIASADADQTFNTFCVDLKCLSWVVYFTCQCKRQCAFC